MNNIPDEISIDPADVSAVDNLLRELGLDQFKPQSLAYRVAPNEKPNLPEPAPVQISLIRPPVRNAGVRQLVRHRAANILRGFAGDVPMPAVLLYASPVGAYAYRLGDGFHRYHLSRLVGFIEIPATILTYWEPWMTGDPMS